MSITENTTALSSILDAVNALPEAGGGATVQTTNGSFSTDSNGTATVNCGFKPDFVFVKQGYVYEYNNESYPVSASFAFTQSQSENVYTTFWNKDDEVTDFFAKRTSNGFSVNAVEYGSDWQGAGYQGSFEYVAVKFT